MLKELPLGTSIFETLRATDELYVDKTDLIYQLARRRSKCFLARPRRFGKSLLISTFESLFQYGLREFPGTCDRTSLEGQDLSRGTLGFFQAHDVSQLRRV